MRARIDYFCELLSVTPFFRSDDAGGESEQQEQEPAAADNTRTGAPDNFVHY